MFGISFSETCLIILIAFLIFGPKRIQEVAFKIGTWVGRIRTEIKHFKETKLTDLDDSTFYKPDTEMNKNLTEIKNK